MMLFLGSYSCSRFALALLYAACAGGFLHAASAPADQKGSAEELRIIVGEWADVRKEIAAEENLWNDTEESMRREIALLEKEKSALETEIAEARDVFSSAINDRAELTSRRKKAEAILEDMEPAVASLEAFLRSAVELLPPGVVEDKREVFARIPGGIRDTEGHRVTERLQAAIGVLSSLESLHGNLGVSREMITVSDGERREMRVFYVGLSRAFAASEDGRHAAIGVPSPDGWSWQAAPRGLGSVILRALAILDCSEPAEFVLLPMKALNQK